MKIFYQLLGNSLIAAVTNNFVWFAIVFWIYLETQSVISTSVVGGLYLVATALSGFWFGSIVDHNKKKQAMLISSVVSLAFYLVAAAFYLATSSEVFKSITSPELWVLVVILMTGVIAGNIRNIALPTTVTLLVPADDRDRANGMSGTMIGIAFSITSFASGIVLAYWGMPGVMALAIGFTLLALLHLSLIDIPEEDIVHTASESKEEAKKGKIDIRGTIKVIQAVPGLFGLLFFNVINNLLGGVFMALMDAYGLSLVSVQVWGVLWGFISLGFIVGGLIIAKKGLGKKPLRTMFMVNIILWVIAMFFTIQPSIYLLASGMLLYISLIPFVEASEQTVIQLVVPMERQGRVFGFAQSMEQSASPLVSFLIGPIAQFIFIPFMTTGAGVELIGDWFGTGPGRGIALVFTVTGIIGLIVTIIALNSKAYRLLSAQYDKLKAA